MENNYGEEHHNQERNKDSHYRPPCPPPPPPPPKKKICAEDCGKIIIEKGPVNIFINCCTDDKDCN